MSSRFYENVFNKWVIHWSTREELLGVYHERGRDYYTNKSTALLGYVESFLNNTPKTPLDK